MKIFEKTLKAYTYIQKTAKKQKHQQMSQLNFNWVIKLNKTSENANKNCFYLESINIIRLLMHVANI